MKTKPIPKEIFKADQNLADFLAAHNEKKIFQTPTEIIFQDHIPIAAYFLPSGKIEIVKNKKTITALIGENFIFGAAELFHNKPFQYSIHLSNPSEMYILCRSSLNEAMDAGYMNEIVNPKYLQALLKFSS